MLGAGLSVKAQAPRATGELLPGDLLPAVTTARLMRPDGAVLPGVRVSDYRGKLLLLDFWATWCTSCIANMDKIDTLLRLRGDKIAVLGVNERSSRDTEEKVRRFFATAGRRGNVHRFSTVVGDTLLGRLFPHRFLPHYAWIGRDGRLLATTSGDALTLEQVDRFYAGGSVSDRAVKKDVVRERPLLLEDHPALAQLSAYSILIKGTLAGVDNNLMRSEGAVTYGRRVGNRQLQQLFSLAGKGAFPGWTQKRFSVDVADTAAIQERYTYELIVPKENAARLYKTMLEDLQRSTPYRIAVERRRVPVVLLEVIDPSKVPLTQGGKAAFHLLANTQRHMTNYAVSYLINWLNAQMPGPEAIDATGLNANIDVAIPDGTALSVAGLNPVLERLGLRLRPEQRELDCYILRDKLKNP